jgi:ABC-2 type transport system permease protein
VNLVRAELFKIRTTATWWIMALILLPLHVSAVLINWLTSYATLQAGAESGSSDQAQQIAAAQEPVNVAASMFTSGQFVGVLMVLLFSAIIVTSEFFHLTATATFLVTPRREAVILAKFGTAVIVALVTWLVTTILNLIFVPIIMDALNLSTGLGEPAVWRAIGLNALAYALWAVLGVGAGVLIRSQIAATLTLSIVYVVGTAAVSAIFALLTNLVAEWIGKLEVLVPTTASQLMLSGTDLPGSPPRWVGAVVLIGYALTAGTIGTVITKRRDIS